MRFLHLNFLYLFFNFFIIYIFLTCPSEIDASQQSRRFKRGGENTKIGHKRKIEQGSKDSSNSKTTDNNKRVNEAIQKKVRRTNMANGLEEIVGKLPKDLLDLLERKKKGTEVSKMNKLKAACYYINWLRNILNRWKDQEKEAREYNEKIQLLAIELQLEDINVFPHDFNWPTMNFFPVLELYTKETVHNLEAMVDHLARKNKDVIAKDSKSDKERRHVIETAYFKLFRLILPCLHCTNNRILDEICKKISQFESLKKQMEEEKVRFRKVFPQYEIKVNQLTALGTSLGLHIPNNSDKPLNKFSESIALEEPKDYFYLPPDAVNSLALEQPKMEQTKQTNHVPLISHQQFQNFPAGQSSHVGPSAGHMQQQTKAGTKEEWSDKQEHFTANDAQDGLIMFSIEELLNNNDDDEEVVYPENMISKDHPDSSAHQDLADTNEAAIGAPENLTTPGSSSQQRQHHVVDKKEGKEQMVAADSH